MGRQPTTALGGRRCGSCDSGKLWSPAARGAPRAARARRAARSLAIIFYLLSYHRYRRLLLEAPPSRAGGRLAGLGARLLEVLDQGAARTGRLRLHLEDAGAQPHAPPDPAGLWRHRARLGHQGRARFAAPSPCTTRACTAWSPSSSRSDFPCSSSSRCAICSLCRSRCRPTGCSRRPIAEGRAAWLAAVRALRHQLRNRAALPGQPPRHHRDPGPAARPRRSPRSAASSHCFASNALFRTWRKAALHLFLPARKTAGLAADASRARWR